MIEATMVVSVLLGVCCDADTGRADKKHERRKVVLARINARMTISDVQYTVFAHQPVSCCHQVIDKFEINIGGGILLQESRTERRTAKDC